MRTTVFRPWIGIDRIAISLFILLLAPATAVANIDPFVIKNTNDVSIASDIVLDVRAESLCLQQSLPDAMCMPTEAALTSRNRLANFAGLYWLLGSLGLDGSEHVAIVGNNAERREFAAGLLFVAGQARIDVVSDTVENLLKKSKQADPGKPLSGKRRSNTRTTIFKALPRTNRLILKSELAQALHKESAPVLLDGRTESEYWGQSSRTARAGHIPGAMHAAVPLIFDTESANLPVAYAHDSFSGLAYLARLIAADINTRVYAAGWSEWSADAKLPADAESFLNHRNRDSKPTVPPVAQARSARHAFSITAERVMLMVLTSILLLGAAFYLGAGSNLRKAQ